ncbi:hypothetical protein ACFSOZ_24320 [Mesorhizobium newzealandense]|uniref:Uncharacterized protein n=1 Tax=Mesorhizobium newzealandense TaxID=1300302 RepID=A0ABW4UHL5_9HYPH
MTEFLNLKTKYPDLIPIRMDFECGPGWEKVLDKYFGEVAAALPSETRLRLERVYEKYGSLWVDAMPEGPVANLVHLALDKAEVLADSRSYRYCETCGEPGGLRDKHWLYVACEAHANGAPLSRQTNAGSNSTVLPTNMMGPGLGRCHTEGETSD